MFTFSEEAWNKLVILRSKIKTEFIVMPLTTIHEDFKGIYIYDLILPEQRVTGSKVDDFKPEELLSIAQAAVKEGYKLEEVMPDMKGLIHSHGDMSPFLSKDDDEALDDWGKDLDYCFSLVTNIKGEWAGELRIAKPFPITYEHIKIGDIYVDRPYTEARDWFEKVKDRITKITYGTTSKWDGQWEDNWQHGHYTGRGNGNNKGTTKKTIGFAGSQQLIDKDTPYRLRLPW